MERLTPDRAAALLERLRGVRVLVVGDVMLDRYVTGLVERISPEAPVPVVRVEEESAAVGGAANVAANIVALGARCEVVGCVGTDVYGELLRRELEALGVGTDGLVQAPARPTTVKTRVRARSQQVVRFDREEDGDVSEDVANRLAAAIASVGERADAVAIEDYNKGVLVPAVIRAALDAGRASATPVVVDPKRVRFFAYAGATVFKPNAKELSEALATPLRPDDPAWMEDVRRRLDCRTLVLTLGEHGMAVLEEGGHYLRIPTTARSVYDVSGAGDTVTAVISATLAAGATALEAAVLANHAAAVEVSKAGVATVAPDEILDHIRDLPDTLQPTEAEA